MVPVFPAKGAVRPVMRRPALDMSPRIKLVITNALEALIGAIYLDQGYEAVRDFIVRVVLSRTDEMLEKKLYKDPKSLFQEEAQMIFKGK